MRCIQLLTLFLPLISKTVSKMEPRVFDGNVFRPAFHRHLVLLKINENQPTAGICSGSIISKRWVLSAAHCFIPSPVTVLISHTTKKGKLIDVGIGEAVYKHPQYNKQLNLYLIRETDVALVKTQQPFKDVVKPIALAAKLPKIGQWASIAGYGLTEWHNDAPREGVVKITRCLTGQTDLICSYGKTRGAIVDSGGPIVIEDQLYGVMSTGCDETVKPPCETACASVAYNYEWIHGIMTRY